ncbi:gamma-glutamyl-gamma-aminobutyrate hydrolase family protein [candidate division WOR-3 bacterium]|uniref:Gamma-glutamyl-gamma-aminobutyrate hydrolase family protein n=1 Tax=candidate division WOR-3 bacterium TaxID=2052148 RepID=A0A660SM06_UNCW3|nr:MAG: gamma-glutamyl-gamma-aminobutyrate hydrolase family protein [candidate division WOR-3 bacterium]
MAPLIGITVSYNWEERRFFLARDYVNAIVRSGGVPLMLPLLDPGGIDQVIKAVDGLLLSGGFDVSPILYGREPKGVGKIDPDRDRFEIEIVHRAYRRRLPILAICRGIQLLNVALGGTLMQRLKGLKHFQESERSKPSHSITIEPGSIFYQIARKKKILVNSFHNDAIDNLSPKLRPTGWAEDGIIEVVEGKNRANILGVQFHPECMFDSDPVMRRIFQWFIKVANRSSYSRG